MPSANGGPNSRVRPDPLIVTLHNVNAARQTRAFQHCKMGRAQPRTVRCPAELHTNHCPAHPAGAIKDLVLCARSAPKRPPPARPDHPPKLARRSNGGSCPLRARSVGQPPLPAGADDTYVVAVTCADAGIEGLSRSLPSWGFALTALRFPYIVLVGRRR